jgi:hypothetical protein
MLGAKHMKPCNWAIEVIVAKIKMDMELKYISRMTIESIAR